MILNDHDKTKLKLVSMDGVDKMPLKLIDLYTVQDSVYLIERFAALSGFHSYKLRVDGAVQILERRNNTYIRLRSHKYLEYIKPSQPQRWTRDYLTDCPITFSDDAFETRFDSIFNEYNAWKIGSPASTSLLEENINSWKIISFRLGYLLPFVGLELSFGERFSTVVDGGMNSIYTNSDGLLSLGAAASGEFRFYYDQARRRRKMKMTQYHSANYISGGYAYYYYGSNGSTSLLALNAGFQRAYRHSLSDYFFGLGLDPVGQRLFFTIGLKAGFVF